jgi:hypothetical protein
MLIGKAVSAVVPAVPVDAEYSRKSREAMTGWGAGSKLT